MGVNSMSNALSGLPASSLSYSMNGSQMVMGTGYGLLDKTASTEIIGFIV
jgi:hypothetical protein